MSLPVDPVVPSSHALTPAPAVPDILECLVRAARASSDVLLITDLDGRILWSARGAPVTGRAHGAFDETFQPALDAALTLAAKTGAEHRFEHGTFDAGGVTRWWITSVTPAAVGGTVTALVLKSTDITALKTSEERLKRSEALLLDAQGVAHLGTWEWDVREPFARWSAELYRIHGLSAETFTPSAEAYLERVHPDDRQRVQDATSALLRERRPSSHGARIIRPDGEIRHVHTWGSPVVNAAGTVVKLVGVCQDVTERKLAEGAVRALAAELEQRVAERTAALEKSVAELEGFTGMVSHDLRNPLNAILLTCAAMEQNGPQLEGVRQIQRSATFMAELIGELLTLARDGQEPLDCREVDLGALGAQIIAALRERDPGRTVHFTATGPLRCRGDATLLRAALENLLGNAWKYTARRAGAHIELGASTQGAQTVFHVTDDGVGFDMAGAARLFSPFTRLHDERDFPGTGLGLAAVRRIIERHGGRVWAESRAGEGASFFFTLSTASRGSRFESPTARSER